MSSDDQQSFSLSGQFIIANPGMLDPNFNKTVSFICEHDEEGALGITINRPSTLSVNDVLTDIGLLDNTDQQRELEQATVCIGGPVHPNRGLLLHSGGPEWESSIKISDSLALTSSLDILEAIAQNKAPEQYLLVLGYAGWGPGQLEQEMLDNAWLQAPATSEILFETQFEKRWNAAAASLGIDLSRMSTEAGHA